MKERCHRAKQRNAFFSVNAKSLPYFINSLEDMFLLSHWVIFMYIHRNIRQNYNTFMTLIMSQNEIELPCFFYTVGILCYVKLLYKSTYHPKCRNYLKKFDWVKNLWVLNYPNLSDTLSTFRTVCSFYNFMKNYAETVKQTLCLCCLR